MLAFHPIPAMERPGLWRRIVLWHGPGMIVGGLEDDVHRFTMRLAHDGARITSFASSAERFPWSTCGGAAGLIDSELKGRTLADIARLDRAQHCTHLYELASLCAARADDTGASQFDLRVSDRIGERCDAEAWENGRKIIAWRLDGTVIETPEALAGRDLRRISQWLAELPPGQQTAASLLRRAIFVSGARRQPEHLASRASERPPERMGVCYTYQMPRALDAVQKPYWRSDFSHGTEGPLQGFDPETIARSTSWPNHG